MITGRTRDGGIHVAERESSKRGREVGSKIDVMRVLKEQDAGYLRLVLSREKGVLERLQKQAGAEIGPRDQGQIATRTIDQEAFGDGVLGKRKRTSAQGARRVLFVENAEEQRPIKIAGERRVLDGGTRRSMDDSDRESKAERTEKRTANLLQCGGHRTTKHQRAREAREQAVETRRQELVHRTRLNRQQAIERTKDRIKKLTVAEDAVAEQRANMAKTVVVGGITRNGHRFKIRQRRR